MEKTTQLFTAALVFFSLVTFTIVCILHIESYFFIVCSFEFLWEKYEKSIQKCDLEKTTKKHQNLDQKSTQNCSKLKPKSQRSAKNAPNNMFLRHPKNVEKKEAKKVPKRAFQGARNGWTWPSGGTESASEEWEASMWISSLDLKTKRQKACEYQRAADSNREQQREQQRAAESSSREQ